MIDLFLLYFFKMATAVKRKKSASGPQKLFTGMDFITKTGPDALTRFVAHIPIVVIRPCEGDLFQRIMSQNVIGTVHHISIRDIHFLEKLKSERNSLLKENERVLKMCIKRMELQNTMDDHLKSPKRWSNQDFDAVKQTLIVELKITEDDLQFAREKGVPQLDPLTVLSIKPYMDSAGKSVSIAACCAWYQLEHNLFDKDILEAGYWSQAVEDMEKVSTFPYLSGNIIFINVTTYSCKGQRYLRERLIKA